MYKSWMWKQRSYREQLLGDEGGGGAGAQGGDDSGADQGAGEGGQGDGGQVDAATEPQDGAAGAGDDEGDVVITIGDEEPPASNEVDGDGKPAAQWVKDLRKQARELARENRELKQEKQAAQQQATTTVPAVGTKPTMESCAFDEDIFETELTAWHDRKRAVDEKLAKERKEQEEAQAAWQGKLATYNTAKAALKVSDYDEAEAVVTEALSQTQQAIILNGADKPEVLIYALGKNPAKAKELAAIKDPVKYAFAVAKLETQLKVTHRKAPPAPERAVRGTTAATPGGGDAALDKLRDEALRTGDASKLMAYKASKRQQ